MNNFVQLTRICDCKRSITIELLSTALLPHAVENASEIFDRQFSKMSVYLRAFSGNADERREKGTNVGWDNKWLP